MEKQELKLKLISAVSIDGVIGNDGGMLWHVPEDMKHYKENTVGNVVIVGISTFLSMPVEAFSDRVAVVVCGKHCSQVAALANDDNVYLAEGHRMALDLARIVKKPGQDVYVIGGAKLYQSLIDYVEEAKITWINRTYDGANKRFPLDALFSNFEPVEDSDWIESKSGIKYKFMTYKKKDKNYGSN